MIRKALSALLQRLAAPSLMVGLFLLVMSGCILGLIYWKTSDARRMTLLRAEAEIRNLTHSLSQHTLNTLRAIDVATTGMVDLLRYQQPQPDRFNAFLARTVRDLPQLSEIGALDPAGSWVYASPQMPNDRSFAEPYLAFHRDNPDAGMRISGPVTSRIADRQVIVVTKRITKQDGRFGGIIVAAVESNFFASFYKTFNLGLQGSVSLLNSDGVVLAHSQSKDLGRNLSATNLFQKHLKESPKGYYKIVSPFDGITKYFGYEQIPDYMLTSTVALPESELLSNWRADLQSDLIVAAALFCLVCFMATLLLIQFEHRGRIERSLRDREQRYRLLADNIADIVIRLDRYGNMLFVSQSVEAVLGWSPDALIGRSCFEMVEPGDVESVRLATAKLVATNQTQTLNFRTYRADRSICWVEIVFKLTHAADNPKHVEIVGVLRDITERKAMEDELTAVNARLAELATTDGLTGLANRRYLDGFLRREFEIHDRISVLLFDIDHFKGFNDRLGHQAGDECLKAVAKIIASATHTATFLSARYGGEEFVIVLPGIAEQHAFIIAESVRLKVKALNMTNPASNRGHISISAGIASKTASMQSEADLVAEADMALYKAKRLGRDRSVIASELGSGFGDIGLVPPQSQDQSQQPSQDRIGSAG